MTNELLEWHDAGLIKPDADITVLCWGGEGFFSGWWDDEIGSWIGCELEGTPKAFPLDAPVGRGKD